MLKPSPPLPVMLLPDHAMLKSSTVSVPEVNMDKERSMPSSLVPVTWFPDTVPFTCTAPPS